MVGTTGNQGSSVVNTSLKLSYWHVRASTRDPFSETSKSLTAQGKEVIYADLAEIASLVNVFEGANTIILDPNCKNTVDSAAADPRGSIHAPCTQTPRLPIVNHIEDEQSALVKKRPLIIPDTYLENIFCTPRFDLKSDKDILATPIKVDFRMPFRNPRKPRLSLFVLWSRREPRGMKLLAYNSHSYLSFAEAVERWSKACGKDTVYVPTIIEELHEKIGLPWEFLDGLAYAGYDGVIELHRLKTKVHTMSFDDWLKERLGQTPVTTMELAFPGRSGHD
ncbi:uncharacterized protein BCR38DRAFT_471354 [Pseudomassariella vexata]|uniref:NmrA-like domain-containing protein n=1 Tax=Pseudomassariella vexata TaxID=1141098 RepID=A0A1Y2EF72_9PEZI|nr:uncharacterized protein BCR38DRAFT_471354 [Pseudomassariella vexata]ORY69954.1 hypothetical protein BCR38DRAFT_471354 [Pseudomassariella vexata]